MSSTPIVAPPNEDPIAAWYMFELKPIPLKLMSWISKDLTFFPMVIDLRNSLLAMMLIIVELKPSPEITTLLFSARWTVVSRLYTPAFINAHVLSAKDSITSFKSSFVVM